MIDIPPLEHGSNSWVVTRKATGEVIGEFFDRSNVAKFNGATCRVETAGHYLGRIHLENCGACNEKALGARRRRRRA